jgi:hypothetical protein
MQFGRPRLILVLLLVASAVGVHLTWLSISAPLIIPGASWLAIIGLGIVLGNNLLRIIYRVQYPDEKPPVWLSRRWDRIDQVGSIAGISGLVVRFLTVPPNSGAGHKFLIGIVVVLLVIFSGLQYGLDDELREHLSWNQHLMVGIAAIGICGLAWGDIAMQQKTEIALVIRILHLGAVSIWIGAAVWHNGLVVPALAREEDTQLRPIIRRFQRFIPLLVLAVFATGVYQAILWLGTRISTYLQTSIGHLIGLKLALLLSVTVLIVITHIQTPVTDANSRSGD